LIEKDKFEVFLRRMLKALTSDEVNNTIIEYTGMLNANFKKYIYTQTIDGTIIGAIATVELSLLGSPYALVLGIGLGIINYIPYFGSIVGTLVTVVIVAFTQGLAPAAIALLMLLITQQIDGNIIQPRLMGESFSLSPLLIIISITVGGAFAGIMGMIAAIPTVSVLKEVLENIIEHYEKKKLDANT
jgi:predicted PurR-regulated permease PerM